ncbi:MAG: ABC transporter permease [Chitinivibrionales bacterium]|nr:ABC transporter permease [Chitinivibrionales bacterium]
MSAPFKSRITEKLFAHPLAMPGLVILCFLYAVMVFAEFLAPYGLDNDKRENSYVPPAKLHFYYKGHFSLRPVVYPRSFTFNEYHDRYYIEDTTKPYFCGMLVKGDRVKLWGVFPCSRHLFGIINADGDRCRLYLLGGDSVGRDLLSRIIYGSRVSLTIGLLGAAITFLMGFFIGGLSGYYGGTFDWMTMRFAECFMLVPEFFLMLALRSAFPINLSSIQVYLLIIIIISFIGWAHLARVIRGMALSISKRDFVTAARAMGATDLSIVFRHVLPQTFSYATVSLTLSIPGYILAESFLSLIGLGIQDPQASWGNLLSAAMNISEIQYHPWILLPGVCIFLTVMAFNFIGDGLRDALDPNK